MTKQQEYADRVSGVQAQHAGFHRHQFQMITLAEAIEQIRLGKDHSPFKFCDICGKVPDRLVALTPSETLVK